MYARKDAGMKKGKAAVLEKGVSMENEVTAGEKHHCVS